VALNLAWLAAVLQAVLVVVVVVVVVLDLPAVPVVLVFSSFALG
tara:strand:- start:404 stop:535 length:132 start_codon:yes stop_codon:yes gene_type:complete